MDNSSLNNPLRFLPDYSAPVTGVLPYTAPANGKISVSMSSYNNGDSTVTIDGTTVGFCGNGNSNSGIHIITQFDVNEGQTVAETGGYKPYNFVFYPLKAGV